MPGPRPTAVIACDVLEDEVRRLLREARPEPLLRLNPMGMHDHPDSLRKKLQADITELESAGCQRLIFVYGLCSNSILGLRARSAEMIFPRAHDCITLFLGSKERYAAVHHAEPGTYWFTPGWCRGGRTPSPGHFTRLAAEYRERFDEDDAEYLMEMEREKYAAYTRAAYTDLGDGPTANAEQETRSSARELGLRFEHIPGDDRLLARLLLGPWDAADFLTVPPGQTLEGCPDARIIRSPRQG